MVEYSDQKNCERIVYCLTAADKIGKISMFSDFNENLYLRLFWSEELIGNDENCIQGHFYEATIFKMAANKIVKLSMVWFQWKLISRSILKWGIDWCPEFWYGGCLHPNTIKPSYYYYYYYSSSFSSRRVIVRPNSQRLMIRSLLSFTGRWIPI